MEKLEDSECTCPNIEETERYYFGDKIYVLKPCKKHGEPIKKLEDYHETRNPS